MSVNVHVNMIQWQNDQRPKRRGRFTGQRLKVLRPDTYRRVMELLAEPREQVPYDHICRLLHVSEHTVKAIEKAETASIAERKERLLRQALRIASKAADRVENQIDGANITQATVAFGVATEKAVLLGGGPMLHSVNYNVDATPFDLAAAFTKLVEQVEGKVIAVMKENELLKQRAASQLQLPPPNSETISDHPAGNGSAAGEENA
jgi:hypothetical protein